MQQTTKKLAEITRFKYKQCYLIFLILDFINSIYFQNLLFILEYIFEYIQYDMNTKNLKYNRIRTKYKK